MRKLVTIANRDDIVVLRQETYILPEISLLDSFEYQDNSRLPFLERQEFIQTLGGELHNPEPMKAAVISRQKEDDAYMHHYFEHGKRIAGPNGYAAELICIYGDIKKGFVLNEAGELDLAHPHQDMAIILHLLQQNKNDATKAVTPAALKTLEKKGVIRSQAAASEIPQAERMLHIIHANNEDISKSVPINAVQDNTSAQAENLPQRHNM